ncbi:maleylpyruvate isomerase family mycothiol-dependent enzyme [Streptomyces sp. NPDC017993]|uniref:maleylpyruvate isomerase family mycothiol-dependent enzyme n=1 Tax=Streptomyces sp. NPDC017993 TaxID=3365027 RepID=UPI0037B5DDC2
MGSRADGPIQALRTGHEQLSSFVAQLPAHDLERVSAADEWTVAQVLSHLGSGAEISLATLEAALAGSGAPDGEFNEKVWARWDAMSPKEQAENFARANETLVRRYEGLDEATRAELTIDLGFLPEPLDVAAVAALRLGEFTYHTWDIQAAFDPAAVLAPGAVEHLFQPLGMLIGFLGTTGELGGRRVSLAVRTERPELSLGLELGEEVTLTDAPADPDGVLEIPAEAALRLVVGRLAPEHAPSGTRLTGGGVSLDELRRVFPGF